MDAMRDWISKEENLKFVMVLSGLIGAALVFVIKKLLPALLTLVEKGHATYRKIRGKDKPEGVRGSPEVTRPVPKDAGIEGLEDIVLLLGDLGDGAKVFVQRMRPVRQDEASLDGLKEDEHGRCEIARTGHHYKILKRVLADHGFGEGDPYKFYCLLPNEPARIDACMARLCRADCFVTGEGQVDPGEKGQYRVWFISGREPTKEKPHSLFLLNNRFEYKGRRP